MLIRLDNGLIIHNLNLNLKRFYFFTISDENVLADVRRIVGDGAYTPSDPSELAGKLFTTCYMGTENSSEDTRSRAAELAGQIGR